MAGNRELYLPIVQREAARAGIPWQLLDAMIQQESGYNPAARGDNGNAWGLGQLWAPAAIDAGIDPAQRMDPETNIRGAANYAAIAYRNASGDWRGTAALYNAGAHRRPGAIPAASSAWTHAANVQRRAGELGHTWQDAAAAAGAAPGATTASTIAAAPPGFRGIDYPEPPRLSPVSIALNLPEMAAAPRQTRQLSLQEILGYGNLRPPGWYPG